jgi:hypothetical protein
MVRTVVDDFLSRHPQPSLLELGGEMEKPNILISTSLHREFSLWLCRHLLLKDHSKPEEKFTLSSAID